MNIAVDLGRKATKQTKKINPSLVLVQPRKTRSYVKERLLMGRKESNQTNKTKSQAIGLLVPEKKIFKGFYHIWA